METLSHGGLSTLINQVTFSLSATCGHYCQVRSFFVTRYFLRILLLNYTVHYIATIMFTIYYTICKPLLHFYNTFFRIRKEVGVLTYFHFLAYNNLNCFLHGQIPYILGSVSCWFPVSIGKLLWWAASLTKCGCPLPALTQRDTKGSRLDPLLSSDVCRPQLRCGKLADW